MKINLIATWKAWKREELLGHLHKKDEKFRPKKRAVMVNAIFS